MTGMIEETIEMALHRDFRDRRIRWATDPTSSIEKIPEGVMDHC
jgi:hypothetical protein